MKKTKALKKDLRARFSGTIGQAVQVEDPSPSKKVKKLINKSSKQLAAAVLVDTKKARKKAKKVEKKALKAEKKKKKSAKKVAKQPIVQEKNLTEQKSVN